MPGCMHAIWTFVSSSVCLQVSQRRGSTLSRFRNYKSVPFSFSHCVASPFHSFITTKSVPIHCSVSKVARRQLAAVAELSYMNARICYANVLPVQANGGDVTLL